MWIRGYWVGERGACSPSHLYETLILIIRILIIVTLVIALALIFPVWRTCGPLQRSMSEPQRYTVVVGVVTFSLSIRNLNLLYYSTKKKKNNF